jgi:uncharacterized protein YacL
VSRREVALPATVFEVLRLCIVVFFAGLGQTVAEGTDGALPVRVGPLDATAVGVVLGASVGYLLGGVVARVTDRTVRETERMLAERSTEQLLAGLTGSVVGVLGGAGLSWPVLLVGIVPVTVPVFAFACIATGTLGYRVGVARRATVLQMLGQRHGVEPASTDARILDTSVAVDGRIVDVVRAGFLPGAFLIPQPVLGELQGMADSSDDTRRARGRRGLDVLHTLRAERGVDLEVTGDEAPDVADVDGKLVRTALERGAVLLTLDTGLARVASLAGCRVMNLHALSLALRPPVLAGDEVRVLLTRAGKEAGQAVGYLDDGTMVVVEAARDRIGGEVTVSVTSVLTTANGRMVFARPVPVPVL